jgi:hypothetical protein
MFALEVLMRRRTFLSLSLAAAAMPASAKTETVAIAVGDTTLATMPADFNGLSYENTQLYNPDYFSTKNAGLVAAFRGLSKAGVLRLGGSLSNSCRWKSEAGTFETPAQTAIIEEGRIKKWEWKLCDPTVKRDGAITPAALASLRGFCDATGWRVIYGLDCTAGGPERARDEGAHVVAALGDKLLAFQVGNEADFLPQYKRNPSDGIGDFERYYRDYQAFVAAVHQAAPNAPFAGPDTAVAMDWVDAFGKREGKKAAFLSSHLYDMGPGNDPNQNAELLLSGKSRLPNQIAEAAQAMKNSGVPFRLTEVNSCYRGGRPGVSDAYAAALWCADMMLKRAAVGWAGVNLHGGGDGIYTPIEAAADGSTKLRPLYYGMQFAEHFAGAELMACEAKTGANVTAYAARKGERKLLALINKGAERVTVAQTWVKPARITRLTAPALDAKTGVVLKTVAARGATTVPAYSAVILIG